MLAVMPNPVRMKQNDTAPALVQTLTIPGTTRPLDLADAVEVRFIMRLPERSRAKVDDVATVLQAVDPLTSLVVRQGQVSFPWMPGDTDVTGVYNAEFEVTWRDGTTQSWPEDGYLQVVISADLA